jgi:hypothetical protein
MTYKKLKDTYNQVDQVEHYYISSSIRQYTNPHTHPKSKENYYISSSIRQYTNPHTHTNPISKENYYISSAIRGGNTHHNYEKYYREGKQSNNTVSNTEPFNQ